uniref:Serine/threonine-protein phosphatase 4 regulatory subunit 4 n=1 Tax=Panagrolaimus sp. PS1159 TaxID=55785 RepID=A0AC35GF06_9BILA
MLFVVADSIVPLTVSQAVSTKRIQRRVISARLIEKLCAIIPVESIKKDLAPCTKMLCQDPNATVRTAIAQRLSVIAQSLNNSSDCVSLLLPCLIELCKDDDSGVREAILNTIAVCLPYFTKESRKTVVLPLLRKCTEQALILRDTSLIVVSKQLAPWLYALKEILSPQEMRWFLDTYSRIVNLNAPDSDKSLQILALTCRRQCAYNFPCFAMIYSGDLFNDRLLPILEKFCSENDEEIRSTIAAGFHEILLLRPDEPSLLQIFTELIKTGAVEIIQHLVKDLHKAIPILYQMVKKEQEKRAPKTTRVQLDRLIVGCNGLIRNTGNWRSHESYLMNLIVLKKILPPNDLFVTFVPVLKQEVLKARALPCRIAAAVALLHLMREFPLSKNRQNVIEFFTKTVGQHQSCHRRRILLDIVPMVQNHFSRDFFKENFLQAVLKLANDPVSNIRLQLCRMMPRIKKFLFFPDDEPAILSLEKSVRSLLTSESSSNNDRHLLQQYACDLSRSETTESLKNDATKVAEEKRLWTEIESASTHNNLEEDGAPQSPLIQKAKKGVTHRRKNGTLVTVGGDGSVTSTTTAPNTSTSSSAYATSTISRVNGISSSRPPIGSSINDIHAEKPPSWKTNRIDKTKIAVVRPQPQVTLLQRSPSPMPPKGEDTKSSSSKLPLSTRYRSYQSASSSPTTSSPPSSARYRSTSTYRSDSTPSSPASRSALSYSSRHSSYTPTSSPLMSKSMTSSYTGGTSSSSYTPSSSGLMSSRSLSQIRRPYSLMKVQSSSAIEHKPTNIKLRVLANH